jgi:hypothetical protein
VSQNVWSGADYTPFTTVAGVVKPRAGRLMKIVVTAAVTGSITVYDNPSAASGNILFVSPAAPTVGTEYVIDVPAKTGMWCVPGSAGGFNVIWN